MSLKLNSSGGGSVTLQEPTTASNVTLNLPAADGTVVYENASGNVGIGTSSPNEKLMVAGAIRATSNAANWAASDGAVIDYNAGDMRIVAARSGSNSSNITFTTFNAGANAERARINASGNFGVGTTTPGTSYSELVNFTATATNQPSLTLLNTNASFANDALQVRTANSSANGNSWNMITGWSSTTTLNFLVRGNGNVLNSNNSYGSLSDQRLKENIVDATPKLEKLNQVRIVNFNIIGDEQKQLGVVAQELEQIFPGMIEEGSDGMKGVKYSVFVPMLIKAIQELKAEVDSLRAQVEAQ
jgi:hypothetical protein